jgi:hypothetical protein
MRKNYPRKLSVKIITENYDPEKLRFIGILAYPKTKKNSILPFQEVDK